MGETLTRANVSVFVPGEHVGTAPGARPSPGAATSARACAPKCSSASPVGGLLRPGTGALRRTAALGAVSRCSLVPAEIYSLPTSFMAAKLWQRPGDLPRYD